MNAGAKRLVDRPDCFGFVDEITPKLFGGNHPCRVSERFVENPGFGGDLFKAALPMRDIQVPAALRLAIDRTVADQVLERLEAARDLGVQTPCNVKAPARDPLRAGQPAGRVLSLAAIT